MEAQMQHIVEIHNKEPRAGSKILSNGFEIEHRALIQMLSKYKVDFLEFGSIEVIRNKKTTYILNVGCWADETSKSTGGRGAAAEYFLNEDQTNFLGMLLRNSEVSVKFKKALVKDYARCKKLLRDLGKHQTTEEWQKQRIDGKKERRLETDNIKQFIEYARLQGSTNSDRYYEAFSKMENAALFIVAGKFKNLRNNMSSSQLLVIGMADQIVKKAIDDGIKAGLPYKEVFQLGKQRILQYATLCGQSEIIQPIIDKITDE